MTSGSNIVIEYTDKFLVGERIGFRFSARYDHDVAGSSSPVCNQVSIAGEDSGTANAQACLTVPPCGSRDCAGEIYGTDFTTGLVLEADPRYGSITVGGWCETEGTCEISDRFQMNNVVLVYTAHTTAIVTGIVGSNVEVEFVMPDMGDGLTPLISFQTPLLSYTQ